ncbi:unnamed protein product [Rhizoctonia solani]|uniref:Uncharacterized protein n=1 Tax=Rhizoctonia solani TaxID=456999 RepID=A0A8H3CXP5_9AGAM|nr:unnamed protein product [Rhizoctonia solani]
MSEEQGCNANEVMDDTKNLTMQEPRSSHPETDGPRSDSRSNSVEAIPSTLTDSEYIKFAIREGDNIKANQTPQEPVEQRALIVAPVYSEHDSDSMYGPLSETTRDARLVHELLVRRFRYHPKNIRILSDAVNQEELNQAAIYPTQDNILRSLDWLVNGARANDRRFFHCESLPSRLRNKMSDRQFAVSGHGINEETNAENGNISRIMLPVDLTSKEDTERRPQNMSSPVGRVTSQEIEKSHITYYRQFILTKASNYLGIRALDHVTAQDFNLKFAGLPAGCRLTCLMDCCHSGRMIGNVTKLGGSGFRLSGDLPPLNFNSLSVNLSKGGRDQEKAITLTEVLSDEERDRDQIKAETLTWGSAHSRQQSGHDFTYTCGLLIGVEQAFVDILGNEPAITVKELHRQIHTRVSEKSTHGNRQYVQLAMSPKETTVERQRDVLNERVAVWMTADSGVLEQ